MRMKDLRNAIVAYIKGLRIVRLFEASIIYKRAVEEAEEKYSMFRHRYFVIWDAAQMKLITITYDIYKGCGDSYQYLVRRGRFQNRISRSEMKELSFYYTRSPHCGHPCTEMEAKGKMLEFMKFYMKRTNPKWRKEPTRIKVKR